MNIDIGDYVEFTMGVISRGKYSPGKLYGEVMKIDNVVQDITVILSEEFESHKIVSFPIYFATKITKEEYNKHTPRFQYGGHIPGNIYPVGTKYRIDPSYCGINIEVSNNPDYPPEICVHDWEPTYQGMFDGKWLYNCKYCQIAKEII